MKTIELDRGQFDELLHLRISTLESQPWNEDVLHGEWRKLENAAHGLLEDQWQPQWDYAIPDWPTNIPLFHWVLNNRKLCEAIALSEVQECLSGLTLDWHIRLECYDMIHGSQMVGGTDLGESLIKADACWHWRSPVFAFKESGQR